MRKMCLECGKRFDDTTPNSLKKYCSKKCKWKYCHRKDYEKNKEAMIKKSKKYSHRRRKSKEFREKDNAKHKEGKHEVRVYKLNFKKDKSCVKCGWKEHTEILVFHHKNSKEKEKQISVITSLPRLKREILKCILLCPNCHMWLHYQIHKKQKVRYTKKITNQLTLG